MSQSFYQPQLSTNSSPDFLKSRSTVTPSTDEVKKLVRKRLIPRSSKRSHPIHLEKLLHNPPLLHYLSFGEAHL